MDKKGIIVTHLSFKKYILFYIFLFLLLFGLIYVYPKIKTSITTPNFSCEGIIPDRLLLYEMNGRYSSLTDYKPKLMNYWKDNSEIKGTIGMISCLKGQNDGENINYVYCPAMGDLLYSNTPISQDGTIGKEIIIKIHLVLNPLDKTEEGYKVIDYQCSN